MIIYVLKEKISFNYPSFSHINLNNIVYCMHAIFIVTTHKYLQRVSCREVYVLHTYILSLYNVLSLSFFRNPLISPGVEKQKEKNIDAWLTFGEETSSRWSWWFVFCLESWNPRFGEDADAEDDDAHLSLMMFLLI